MHVLTVLDWVRSLWHSLAVDFAPAPKVLPLADLLEVYEEAIASPQAALQLFAQQLVSHSTAGIQFARYEANVATTTAILHTHEQKGDSDRHAAETRNFIPWNLAQGWQTRALQA